MTVWLVPSRVGLFSRNTTCPLAIAAQAFVGIRPLVDRQPHCGMQADAVSIGAQRFPGLIAQTATAARCSVLYGEDMRAGVRIAGVLIVNPFI